MRCKGTGCGRKVLYRVRGQELRTDPKGEHDLCQRCWRDLQNRLRAERLKARG